MWKYGNQPGGARGKPSRLGSMSLCMAGEAPGEDLRHLCPGLHVASHLQIQAWTLHQKRDLQFPSPAAA